jgi:hypothetical protein
LPDVDAPGLIIKSDVARKQMDTEKPDISTNGQMKPGMENGKNGAISTGQGGNGQEPTTPAETKPKRFHGAVVLDPARVGRDASRIADEVIAHLSGLVDANVRVTLEIEADISSGAPDNVVRTVTENSRTLKFTSQGFEKE